jgi:hypothetical protein
MRNGVAISARRSGQSDVCSLDLGESPVVEVGCYLTILVKRSRHYTIGLDPKSRSVTDRERCQASHGDCLHCREQTLRFVLLPPPLLALGSLYCAIYPRDSVNAVTRA